MTWYDKTKATVVHLLDYLATQEEAIITYNASDMILQVHSGAGYANVKGARNQAGGHFFLSNNNSSAPNNGAILTMLTIINAVMLSVAEAELGALFLNAKEEVFIRQILTEMGHPQPRTPIQTDNTTAEAVVNNRVQPKRLIAMDMRIHWLKCREAQGQFRIHWRPDQTSCTCPPCKYQVRIPHSCQRSSRSKKSTSKAGKDQTHISREC